MDVEARVLQPLAELQERFRERLAAGTDWGAGAEDELLAPFVLQRRVQVLCDFMSGRGFSGCEQRDESYYDARNSRMDQVLERRTGIPITLSLAYMQVGRAGGIELQGVAFPGHFLLGFGRGEGAGLLDAYSNRIVNEDEAALLLAGVFGRPVRIDPGWRSMPRLPNAAFLLRMVRNLQNVYERDGNFAQAAQV
ncbi:unnamed protein product, partial [Prorocentrum cordatum]